ADGTIAGFWYDPTAQENKAFLRAPDGTITSFDHPDSKVTAAYAIDNDGIATGYYSVDEGNHPGFIRETNGKLDIFHAPGDDNGTYPNAMTNKGVIAGTYYDFYSTAHGFVRHSGGNIAVFDVTGDTYGTNVLDINTHNATTGHWGSEDGFVHGF